MIKKYWPHFLFIVYLIEFIYCAIYPISLDVWLDKNLIAGIIVLFFVILYVFKIRFSNISYTLAILFPIVSTLGGYLGFGDNSINVFNNIVSIGSDVFEKLGHFFFGFYAYPSIELLLKTNKINSKWLASFIVIGIIGFITMDYEMIEIFDAIKTGAVDVTTITTSKFGILYIQKDIFTGTIGAIVSSVIYLFINRKKN